MAALHSLARDATYLNPVFDRPFPDPFVLKFCGEYWGYATGFWHDGRCFGVARSRDLVHWREVGSAMDPLPGGATCYWAPEVSCENGRFLMYYSVGNEERMQIRVAVADHPAGPFIDSGHRLTAEDFAIDPHVFVDDDGARYLFYATDFLEHTYIGTGTVYDRMLDAFTLAGRPRPVARARYDWQVYDPHRAEKGGVRWHTVEGPFVLKHKGRYYEMLSGGNWKNISYGVSYAVTDSLARTEEWQQAGDGVRVLPILRTLPGLVVGPGHNSVVRGPDNRQLFCVYHRWAEDGSGRMLSIDPLDWAGERMLVLGPSTGPQPAPLAPTVVDYFDEDQARGLGQNWECTPEGCWAARGGAAVEQSTDSLAEARCLPGAPSFLAEVSLRSLGAFTEASGFGVSLYGKAGAVMRCLIVPSTQSLVISKLKDGDWIKQQMALLAGFDPRAYHLLRVEVDGLMFKVQLDEAAARWQGWLYEEAGGMGLVTQQMSAAFAGFALTAGWEDSFTQQNSDPISRGWRVEGEGGQWQVEEQQLWQQDARARHAVISKGPLLSSYELVINARLGSVAASEGCYGFFPALGEPEQGPLLTMTRRDAGWELVSGGPAGVHSFPLPPSFEPTVYQQFRFRKQGGRLTILWEAEMLGEVECPAEATRVGLYAHGAAAAFEMVRVTAKNPRSESNQAG